MSSNREMLPASESSPVDNSDHIFIRVVSSIQFELKGTHLVTVDAASQELSGEGANAVIRAHEVGERGAQR